jgi:prevent-host-death family protein
MYMSAESLASESGQEPASTTMSVGDARQHLADAIEQSRHGPVTLTRRGRPAAVLVDPAQFHRMLDDLEDADDVAAARSAVEEPGDSIPWAQVKADLGL